MNHLNHFPAHISQLLSLTPVETIALIRLQQTVYGYYWPLENVFKYTTTPAVLTLLSYIVDYHRHPNWELTRLLTPYHFSPNILLQIFHFLQTAIQELAFQPPLLGPP
jgi:hypothetical protein